MKMIKVEKTSSQGIAIGKVCVLESNIIKADRTLITEEKKDDELKKYDLAVKMAVAQLEKLAAQNEIFEAHIQAVQDPALYDGVSAKITEELKNVQLAVEETYGEYVTMFESMDDEYFKERSADIKDINKRVLAILQGKEIESNKLKKPVVIVAKDLTPSDTANLDMEKVLGFITQEGGVTSHVCIMARNIGLPALVGVADILQSVKDEDEIVMDAGQGEIIIKPDYATKAAYEARRDDYIAEKERLMELANFPAITTDKKQIKVYANIGDEKELAVAQKYHAEGVGLFRSEFLYMENSHFPTEEEQFEAYKYVVQNMRGEVIIRTLDIGGDKELSYHKFDAEENPFLGYRAIRISLDQRHLFKTQVRALLRASAFGMLKIMFPMIICLEELRAAKECVCECKAELLQEGVKVAEQVPIGMMIETPASVILADVFASEVDFFSIGTNDLTQYLLAVDRGNKKIANMYDSFHPAVLRAIKTVIDAGHKAGIEVGMCGEFASDEMAVKLLLGMGLDEFSMSAGMMPKVKELIRGISCEDAKQYANHILKYNTLDEIKGNL